MCNSYNVDLVLYTRACGGGGLARQTGSPEAPQSAPTQPPRRAAAVLAQPA